LEPESLLQKPSYPSEHLYSLHNWDAPEELGASQFCNE
jgi:hypothetical protein